MLIVPQVLAFWPSQLAWIQFEINVRDLTLCTVLHSLI